MEELIAEEESSKKKKAKKKKKKNAKKNQETVEEEPEDFDINDPDSKKLGDTEDEDSHGHAGGGSSHGHRSMNSGVVDPTSVDINQWIKVKNKYSGKLNETGGGAKVSTKSANSNTSSTTSSSSGPGLHHDHDEMESNGFKLIGGNHASGDKRRNSNLDSVTKDFDGMSLGDGKTVQQTNILKGKEHFVCFFDL